MLSKFVYDFLIAYFSFFVIGLILSIFLNWYYQVQQIESHQKWVIQPKNTLEKLIIILSGALFFPFLAASVCLVGVLIYGSLLALGGVT